MNHEDTRAHYHAIARRLSARGYRVINGCGERGFWVRNADLTKPPFVDARGFISYAKAKLLFQEKETNEMKDFSESTKRSGCRTYVRDLDDGVRLEGQVSPCVFMYPGYPLQV